MVTETKLINTFTEHPKFAEFLAIGDNHMDNDLKQIGRWLDEENVMGTNILCVGCLEEPTANILQDLGASVTGVDMREYGRGDIPNGFDNPIYEHIVSDFSKFETNKKFDIAISISAIEHFGIGYYKEVVDEDGDKKAMAKILSLLKPGGFALITVPIGGSWCKTYHWRRYAFDTLDRITNGFHVEREEYWLTARKGQEQVDKKYVESYHESTEISVVLKLRKLG